MTLHDETKKRLQELLRGRDCYRCRRPAQRLWRQKYFCQDCFPARNNVQVRVHRTSLSEKW